MSKHDTASIGGAAKNQKNFCMSRQILSMIFTWYYHSEALCILSELYS